MTRLQAKEYQTLSCVALDAQQRDALLGVDADLTISPTRGTTTQYEITTGSRVGVLEIPGISIRITPKCGVHRLFTMLSIAGEAVRWSSQSANFTQEAGVEDVVAKALTEAIRQQLSLGLLRGYVAGEEEAMVVRGRINLLETIRRRPLLCLPLVQEPDDLSDDIPENQVIRAATDLLVPRVRSSAIRGGLIQCRQAFAHVRPLAGGQLPRLRRTRLNSRWWDVIELAALILKWTGMDMAAGRWRGRAFLVDMNAVFERYVHRRLRAALLPHRLELQHGSRRLWLDNQQQHMLVPDLSVWRGEHCLFAGDCKYKVTEKAIRDDLYQALAYATATGLREVLLVYAGGPSRAADVQLVRGGPLVRVRTLDLNAEPHGLDKQFEHIAAEIASVCKAPLPATTRP